MYKFDKTRAHREVLKNTWFNLDHSNTPEVKQITVKNNNIHIVSDGPNGYCGFSTHQKFPLEYVKNCKEYKSGEYELIINGKKINKL